MKGRTMFFKSMRDSVFLKVLRNQRNRRPKPRTHATACIVEVLEPRCLLTLTVPAFSSLPGADHTIYLDFDGHVTENTSWNSLYDNPSIVSPAYNIDGDPLAFGTTELERIVEAWERVTEDFIPFEVNVTTVDPGIEALRNSGSGDIQWGVIAGPARILIKMRKMRQGVCFLL